MKNTNVLPIYCHFNIDMLSKVLPAGGTYSNVLRLRVLLVPLPREFDTL